MKEPPRSTEQQLRDLGHDPCGRWYVYVGRKSLWRGKLNYDHILPLLVVGSLPIYEDDVKEMRNQSVAAVVDLCRDNEDEDSMLAEFGIAHNPEFIPDTKAPLQDQFDRLVRWIDSYIKDGKKVYIHCHAGRGRAPTIACAYLIHTGMSPMQAFDFILEKRKSAEISVSQVQHRALLEYHERHQKK